MKSTVNYQTTLIITGLALLSVAPSHAAKHTKAKQVTHTAHSAAAVTRVFATGSFDPATATVKVITSDNRFAWVHISPNTVVLRGGKRVGAETIQEDDKLLCQGAWIDDQGSLTLRVTSVKIIGQISYGGLHDKIAAACQNATEGSDAGNRVASAETPDATVSSAGGGEVVSEDSVKTKQLSAYTDEMESRINLADKKLNHVIDIFNEGTDNARGYSFLKDRMNQAITDSDSAFNSLQSIPNVPSSMSSANDQLIQSCRRHRDYLNLAQKLFPSFCVGHPSAQLFDMLNEPLIEGNELQKEAYQQAQNGENG